MKKFKEQTAAILSKIENLLNQYGSDKKHILSATIYLKDIDADFKDMNSVWDACSCVCCDRAVKKEICGERKRRETDCSA